ncbi:MAG: hypothetical protein K1X53_17600 [Candidatus Sumerlaeaceae bacterium]|nr:hypothetical protein [Candidatus Sumerlaeaceae bacterium]
MLFGSAFALAGILAGCGGKAPEDATRGPAETSGTAESLVPSPKPTSRLMTKADVQKAMESIEKSGFYFVWKTDLPKPGMQIGGKYNPAVPETRWELKISESPNAGENGEWVGIGKKWFQKTSEKEAWKPVSSPPPLLAAASAALSLKGLDVATLMPAGAQEMHKRPSRIFKGRGTQGGAAGYYVVFLDYEKGNLLRIVFNGDNGVGNHLDFSAIGKDFDIKVPGSSAGSTTATATSTSTARTTAPPKR